MRWAPSRVSCTSITAWCGGCSRKPVAAVVAAAPLEDRRVSAVHPPDAGELPDADRQPLVCHGLRTRLSRQPDYFRHLIACHRPRPKAEAYLRLRTLPGKKDKLTGDIWTPRDRPARRPLMAFVMVLSYSRQIFLASSLMLVWRTSCAATSPPSRHAGIPRVLLYDNLKSAVLERRGDAIRFHPTLLGFAGHYRYEPRPVAVARSNEKGRVERANVMYVMRSSPLVLSPISMISMPRPRPGATAGRRPALSRRPQTQRPRSVRRGSAAPAATAGQPNAAARARRGLGRRSAYVRFDLNDYSVPHTNVHRILTVLADPHEVRVVDAARCSPAIRAATTVRADRASWPRRSAAGAEARRPSAPRHRSPDPRSSGQPDPVDPRRRAQRQSQHHHRRLDAPAAQTSAAEMQLPSSSAAAECAASERRASALSRARTAR